MPATTETHDLLRPIIARTSDATVTRLEKASSSSSSSLRTLPSTDSKEQKRAFEDWMKGLVDEVKKERETLADDWGRPESIERMHRREAVQALIYSSRPGEFGRYDTNDVGSHFVGRFEIVKRHQEIAVLSLPRTAWRTGEAVHGLVRFHREGARFDVLKVCPRGSGWMVTKW